MSVTSCLCPEAVFKTIKSQHMIKATIKMVLDGKPLSNGNYAVYLRILKGRNQKKISIGLQCISKHFVNEMFTKQHPDYQRDNVMLLKLKSRALEVIREFQLKQADFTLVEFEQLFRGEKRNQEIQ